MQNAKLLFDVTFYTEDCVLHFEISFYLRCRMRQLYSMSDTIPGAIITGDTPAVSHDPLVLTSLTSTSL